MIITLTTDFGLRDYFVGCVKGAILTIHPLVRLIDLTHEIPPHDISAGAFVLKESHRYFPKGTVHLAVVDPGVGSARKPIIVQAADALFVGPDNGIFSYILREPDARAFEIQKSKYVPAAPSPTFQGRDRFAPAAAWLSKGIPPEEFGPRVPAPAGLGLTLPRPLSGNRIEGTVVYIDRFGNLITNVTTVQLGSKPPARLRTEGGLEIAVKSSYSEGERTLPAALMNSSGHLEIFLSEGSARDHLGLAVGSKVVVERD